MARLNKSGSIYLQAGSSTELVEQLRALSQLPSGDSLSVFMSLFAHRFERASPGKTVRVDSTDHFIADLISYGWVNLMDKSQGIN